MKTVLASLFIFILISLSGAVSLGTEKSEVAPIEGELEIPENYLKKKETLSQRDQVIPEDASKATSPGSFGGKILEYHLSDLLEQNKFTPLKGLKSLENTVNSNTSIGSESFKLKSTLDLSHLRAELDIETFVNTKIWTEDSFKTLRAQMKLYELNDGALSIQNKTNSDDTRTYLNIEKTW